MSNKTDIATLLPDNTTEQISPKDMRDSFDLVDPEQSQLKFFKATKDFDADISQDNAIAESKRTTGISFTPAVPNSPDINLNTDHIGISVPMRMEGNQVISPDATIAGKSKELITVGSSTKYMLALMTTIMKTVDKQYMKLLDKDNPTMELHVSPAGHAAQMQVLNNGHAVASMEWEKSKQEFFFSLSDKDSGALKAQFEIKPDGHAYIGSKQVATLGDLDRPTVVSAYTATPTKAELVTASKLIPHYTNDVAFWGADHDFYIKDDPQTKMILVKYRGTPTNTSETSAGNYFFEKLTKAK